MELSSPPTLRARLNEAEIFGCGGEAMRLAGVDTVVDAHQVTMIGITEIISGLPRAYRAFHALPRGSGSTPAAACGAD